MRKIFALLKRLRHPTKGCAWDRAQTFAGFSPNIFDEVRELEKAIRSGRWPHVREELGDVLWNVLFLMVLAEEQGKFTCDEVLRELEKKMVDRHPHVFGKKKAASAEEALRSFLAAKEKTRRKQRALHTRSR